MSGTRNKTGAKKKSGKPEKKTLAVLTPPASTLMKLGSIAQHMKEMMSSDGHAFDKLAMEQLVQDPEIATWLSEMDKLALIPKLRKG